MSELDRLTAAASHASTDASSALGALPWLDASIADDRAHHRFARWGRSSVIDENTGTAVIPRELFDALHDRAGLAGSWPIGNAGLLHCYGYLLSTVQTPYGLKRERWIGDDLARACGLPDGAFLPWIAGPTLLERAAAAADGVLAGAHVRRQQIDGRTAVLALSAPAGSAALAYAVAPDAQADAVLVTLFPVADAAAIATEFAADARLRWNAA